MILIEKNSLIIINHIRYFSVISSKVSILLTIVILTFTLVSMLNMMPTSDPTIAQVHSWSHYDINCLRDDTIGSLDQYMNHLVRELADYGTDPPTKNLGHDKDCSDQIVNTQSNLDAFANAFSGNVEGSSSILLSFSEIFDLLIRPSSIALLFSIVVTGIGLNSLKKLKRRTNVARKGFSQMTREKILIKQNHRCVHCRRILTVIDYHHKNGDRSDNKENNCQALCPNCHAIKTRNKLIKN